MFRKRFFPVAVILTTLVACGKGGGTPTDPTPTRANLTFSIQNVAGVRLASGFDYTFQTQLRETAGVPVTLTAYRLTFFEATGAAIGEVNRTQDIASKDIAANGTSFVNWTITDEPETRYAVRLDAVVTFSDAVGSQTVRASANIPALPEPPPGGNPNPPNPNPPGNPNPPPPSTQEKPKITSFSLDKTTVSKGTATTLRWAVTGADSVSINQGIGSVSANGTESVEGEYQTLTYRITARNSAGTSNSSVVLKTSGTDICYVSEVPDDATAICDDGWASESKNRPGTCSSHGGVKCWVCPGPLCKP